MIVIMNVKPGRQGKVAPMPAYLDEVTVLQQPRGSYTLEVFKGYLAVGGEHFLFANGIQQVS